MAIEIVREVKLRVQNNKNNNKTVWHTEKENKAP